MNNANAAPLVFSGTQTVRNTDEAVEKLKELVQRGGPVVIDCSGVEEADISFVQLLLSARRTATELGRSMHLTAPAGGALLACLLSAGLLAEQRAGGGSREFWMSGGGK